jgi:hypothetical protein
MHDLCPLANGIRTDHPVPGLPFVDDSHIPLDDPHAIEAVGRHAGHGMWGRFDDEKDGQWRAFTTDPIRHDLAWCVRYHPDHGRSVLLMQDKDAASMHTDWEGGALLFRAGGYWWDGTTWYRPRQVWDAASEEYDHRPVRSAFTVSAADLLDDGADPAAGRVPKVANFDADAEAPDRWLDQLALWATRRAERKEKRPLSRCVVKLSAPELAGDQLVGVAELAELGGIAASTLRAYISRGEGDVPPPQATVSGRSVWARPVAEDWAEERRRSPDSVAATMAGDDEESLSVGAADVRKRFTRIFFSCLWERPERRKHWALRHRNEAAVLQIADELGWHLAVSLRDIIPTDDLAATITHAVLNNFADGQEGDRDAKAGFYGITPSVARMLDWLIRHHPDRARYTIGVLVGEAERRFTIPRNVTARSLSIALALDGRLDDTTYTEYLDRVLPPNRTADPGTSR